MIICTVITTQDLANAVIEYWKKAAATDFSVSCEEEDFEFVEQLRDTITALHSLNEDQNTWTLTTRSAVRWLHRLGFDYKEVKKGLFKDGHERQDVVDYRQNVFLPTLEGLKPRFLEWDATGEMVRTPQEIFQETGLPPLVPVTHDECIFYVNDRPTFVWTEKDSMLLRKKGHGAGIMVSDFITPIARLHAPFSISDEVLCQHGLDRRNVIEYVKFGGETWWTNELMLAQTINYAIPLFELAFPGCQALFHFDNARNHLAFSKDALRAYKMNFNPGGKAPIMRDG